MSRDHGLFAWNELRTTDPEAAKAFYGEVMGWQTEVLDDTSGAAPYWRWTIEGQAVGGLRSLPSADGEAGLGAHWLACVAVGELAAAMSDLEAAGGAAVATDEEIPTLGRLGRFTDPQGALLGLLQTAVARRQATSRAGHFYWHELVSARPPDVWDFYQQLFGWKVFEETDLGPLGSYRIFRRRHLGHGGFLVDPVSAPVAPHWLPFVNIKDFDATIERLGTCGGTVTKTLETPKGERVSHCQDPQGAAFALHSY